MYHILLTDADRALEAAAQQAMPGAVVHASLDKMQQALANASQSRSICIVEWLPAGMSGLEMCRRIRSLPETRSAHVIMVLDSDDAAARGRALAAGADDYMPGPLHPEALRARLSSFLAPAAFIPPSDSAKVVRTSFGLTVDPEAQQVRFNGRLIVLKPRELRMLEIFLQNSDRLLSRPKIIALLGKEHDVSDERTVDVWVGRLRRTLEAEGLKNVIRTVRPLGYVFDTPSA